MNRFKIDGFLVSDEYFDFEICDYSIKSFDDLNIKVDVCLVNDEYFDFQIEYGQDDLITRNYDIKPFKQPSFCELYSTAQLGNLEIDINGFQECIFNDFG